MPAVFSQARAFLGRLSSLSRTTRTSITAARCASAPLARLFSGSSPTAAGRSSLIVSRARGRAMQELLDEKEKEKEAAEEEKMPPVTTLQWESPLKVLMYPDPKLRAPNAAIGCFDDSLRQLAEEMFVVMYE